MIIKSKEFNNALLKNISELLININNPPNIVGSYKIKENGSMITDIDLQQKIYANEEFIKKLSFTIDNVKHFKFIHLICGQYDQFLLPWSFNDEGGCVFNQNSAITWSKKLKEHIPIELYKKIKNLLISSTLSIKDLFSIREMLKDYSRIIWNKDDIHKGYKEYRGKKYFLLNCIKEKHTTLAVFLYEFKGDYCTIDSSYVDERYLKYNPTLYEYYTNNNYRIFKSMKRMIDRRYFQEFIEAVKKIEKYTSLNSTISTLELIKKYKLLSSSEILNQEKKIKEFSIKNKISLENLKKEIEKISIENIKYFETKIFDTFKPQIILFKIRAKEVSEPIKNIREGCPFFTIQSSELQKLIDISIRAMIVPEKLVDCVKKISIEKNIDSKVLIDTIFSKSKNKIQKVGNNYFYNHEKLTNEKIKEKQKEILFS